MYSQNKTQRWQPRVNKHHENTEFDNPLQKRGVKWVDKMSEKVRKEICEIDLSTDLMKAVLHYSPGENEEKKR
jgi:predicted alpha/beta hydrolase family esterase